MMRIFFLFTGLITAAFFVSEPVCYGASNATGALAYNPASAATGAQPPAHLPHLPKVKPEPVERTVFNKEAIEKHLKSINGPNHEAKAKGVYENCLDVALRCWEWLHNQNGTPEKASGEAPKGHNCLHLDDKTIKLLNEKDNKHASSEASVGAIILEDDDFNKNVSLSGAIKKVRVIPSFAKCHINKILEILKKNATKITFSNNQWYNTGILYLLFDKKNKGIYSGHFLNYYIHGNDIGNIEENNFYIIDAQPKEPHILTHKDYFKKYGSNFLKNAYVWHGQKIPAGEAAKKTVVKEESMSDEESTDGDESFSDKGVMSNAESMPDEQQGNDDEDEDAPPALEDDEESASSPSPSASTAAASSSSASSSSGSGAGAGAMEDADSSSSSASAASASASSSSAAAPSSKKPKKKRTHITPEESQKIWNLYTEGCTRKEIAEFFLINISTIDKHIFKHRQFLNPEEQEKIADARAKTARAARAETSRTAKAARAEAARAEAARAEAKDWILRYPGDIFRTAEEAITQAKQIKEWEVNESRKIYRTLEFYHKALLLPDPEGTGHQKAKDGINKLYGWKPSAASASAASSSSSSASGANSAKSPGEEAYEWAQKFLQSEEYKKAKAKAARDKLLSSEAGAGAMEDTRSSPSSASAATASASSSSTAAPSSQKTEKRNIGEEIWYLYNRGWTNSEITVFLNLSNKSSYSYISERRKSLTSEELKKIDEARAEAKAARAKKNPEAKAAEGKSSSSGAGAGAGAAMVASPYPQPQANPLSSPHHFPSRPQAPVPPSSSSASSSSSGAGAGSEPLSIPPSDSSKDEEWLGLFKFEDFPESGAGAAMGASPYPQPGAAPSATSSSDHGTKRKANDAPLTEAEGSSAAASSSTSQNGGTGPSPKRQKK